jgi:K+-sensing histidine kinase KdpD
MKENNHNDSSLILIVEDNLDYLNYMGKILVENHYEIAVARSKKEALDYLETPHIKRIDLVLLDIVLLSEDDTEGFEVCEQFKKSEKSKQIPIIFLSSHVDEEYILRGFDVGGVDYISKRGGEKNERELLARVKTHIDLKRSMDKIERQKKELEELNATKDKLFRTIAHDLRSPFDTIINNSESLVHSYETLKEDDKLKLIKNIYMASKKEFKLLENLLEWSKVQLKERKPQKCRFDLYSIINDNISLFEENAKTKGITLHNDVSSPCSVFADKAMIDSVIRNLLSNAVKFTGKNGKINVMSLDRGELMEISVSDTGVGIEKKYMDKLFRVGDGHVTPGTGGEKGTGFGLILCKDSLAANNGEIRVESEAGKGSTFSFTLPKNPEEGKGWSANNMKE